MDALLHAVLTARNAYRRSQEARQMDTLVQRYLDWEIENAIKLTKSGAGR